MRIAAPVSGLLSDSTIVVVPRHPSRNGSGPLDVTLGIRPPEDSTLTGGA